MAPLSMDAQTRGRLRAYLQSLNAATALWERLQEVKGAKGAKRDKLIADVTFKKDIGAARAMARLRALYRPILGEGLVIGRQLFYALPCRLEAARSHWADDDPQQAEADQVVFYRAQTGAEGWFAEQAAVTLGRHALARYLQRSGSPGSPGDLDVAVRQFHAALCSLPNWVVKIGLDVWCMETGADGRGRGFPLPAPGGCWVTDFQLQPRSGRPMLVPSFFARTYLSEGLMSEGQEKAVAKVRSMLKPVEDPQSALLGCLHPEWLTNREDLTNRWTIDSFKEIRESDRARLREMRRQARERVDA